MDLGPFTSRSVSHYLANRFRDFSPLWGFEMTHRAMTFSCLSLQVSPSTNSGQARRLRDPYLGPLHNLGKPSSKNTPSIWRVCCEISRCYPDERSPAISFCSLCIWNSLRSFCDLHPHLTADRLAFDRSPLLPQVSTPPGQPCGRGGFFHRDRHSSP